MSLPYVFCPKCKTNVVWPPSLSPEEKSKIAAEVRTSRLAAVKLNHEPSASISGRQRRYHSMSRRNVGDVIAVSGPCKTKCRSAGNAVRPIWTGEQREGVELSQCIFPTSHLTNTDESSRRQTC